MSADIGLDDADRERAAAILDLHGQSRDVTVERCIEWRERITGGETVAAIAKDSEWSRSTVQRHATEQCCKHHRDHHGAWRDEQFDRVLTHLRAVAREREAEATTSKTIESKHVEAATGIGKSTCGRIMAEIANSDNGGLGVSLTRVSVHRGARWRLEVAR